MASKRDYYDVLGVGRSASDQEISNAYRKLALRYHPDRNSEDDAVGKFKEAAEAFEVLSNAEKRTRYDRYGQAGLEGSGGGSPQFHDASDIFEAFGHVFGDLFGGGGGRRGGGRHQAQRGAHVRCEVVLNLVEAARDTTTTVSFRRAKSCSECNGSGAKPGTQPETCNYCGGHGRVVQSTGIFSMQTTCPTCQGQGTIVRNPCAACRGAGVVSEKVRREVQIPAGVDNGSRLRLAGEGEPSPNGGPRGDCYCYIKVRNHDLFQREGRELICQVPITYSQAALGATIDVPTLDGCEQLEIAAGTQTGDVFRMSGRGMPEPGYRGRGNLHVQVAIEVPKKLNDEHRRILRELAEVEEVDVSPRRETFFGKLKEYFQTD